MEPQKLGNSPGPRPEIVERQRVAKERVAQRVSNWTVQNVMRGVQGRVSAGAARRILDSANPKEIKTYQKLGPLKRRRERRSWRSSWKSAVR